MNLRAAIFDEILESRMIATTLRDEISKLDKGWFKLPYTCPYIEYRCHLVEALRIVKRAVSRIIRIVNYRMNDEAISRTILSAIADFHRVSFLMSFIDSSLQEQATRIGEYLFSLLPSDCEVVQLSLFDAPQSTAPVRHAPWFPSFLSWLRERTFTTRLPSVEAPCVSFSLPLFGCVS